ncbi:uncharacterized protein LOC133727119 isoform X1 [Rosa rugosa]|uniref:uncharacterized protein LOC133727119 isoform X1 n=1 Tax=Rosa rugosa TaxID=74645 RepID=UPI002B413330|nr:uncharacterized protein LOC133727119 isoform X1 [Rosa rugosa]
METLTVVDAANIGASILMRFTDSNRELDLEIRKLIVVMSGVFRDHKAPPTPVDYLGATCTSLDIATASMPQASGHVLDAHLTVLSIVIPKVPAAFLIKNLWPLFNSIARPLRSSSLFDESTGCLVVKCIAEFIIAVAKVVNNWSDVSELYSFFLNLATIKALEVRTQLCLCLPDVLQRFQGTPLFDPAIKKITDLLNKYPPLGNHDVKASASVLSQKEKAWFTLDVVKVSLCLMSTEDRTAVLIYFKSLLELNQFPVTARIVDCLYGLCLDPSADVSPELLLDLIRSICLSVTQHKMMYIPETAAGLLSIGVAKVYSFNQKICKTNLPIVFDALKVILGEPKIDDLPDAVHAFKCLIHACIDESLIKEGVDCVVMNASMDDGSKSEPTIIENLCATIQSLLGHCKTTIWALAFEVVSTMFDKLGAYSSYLMRGTLKTLADMQKLPDQEFSFKEEVKLLLKMLVEKCGFDAIMAVMPQEHKKLLLEINEMGSKSVEVISHASEATTVRYHLSQSESSDNQMHDKALGPCKNSKRKMDGGGNEFCDRHARSIAKREMTKRMSGAALMAKKLKL